MSRFASDLDELLERHLLAGGEGVFTLIEALALAIKKLCVDESGPRYITENMRSRR